MESINGEKTVSGLDRRCESESSNEDVFESLSMKRHRPVSQELRRSQRSGGNTQRRRSAPFRFLWITDPWNTLDHRLDTSLRLALEAQELGAENFWCDVRSIRWEEGRVSLDARKLEIRSPERAPEDFALGEPSPAEPRAFSSLQYRTDPPVDLAYLHPLQLLGLDAKARARIVNPPSVLMMMNEKLEGALLGDLMPPTVVSSRWEALESFGRKQGQTVLKPLHQAQSKGVKLLDWRDSDSRDLARREIEAASSGFCQPVLLQRYLPGIADGEVRLWFIDGRLLAFARKLPLKGDFRVDIDRGSGLAPHRITTSERRIAARIGRLLRSSGTRLAAVDLIEGRVTDFNFTSPGLITQMERVLDTNLAGPIVKALMEREL